MNKLPPFLAFFIILIPAIVTDILQVKSWDTTINADGYGYYAYLPCAFIYHSLDYQRVMKEEHKLRPDMPMDEVTYLFEPVNGDNNKLTDKCFVGVSVVLLPFFLLAYFLSYLLGFDLGGYSVLFQESVALAGLVYLFLGLVYLRKLLLSFNVPQKIIYPVLILILYGTNLYYYSTIEPSLSHVYSFSLQAVLFYKLKKYMELPRFKTLVIISFLTGLLFIIRPTNILSLAAIPFLAFDSKKLREFFISLMNIKRILIFIICFLVVILFQLFKWHTEAGKWFVWGYSGEGFIFSQPHFADILFSYRKGWFVYTPLIFVIVAGSMILFLYRRNIFKVVSVLLFFLLTVYVCSCWKTWWYGGSLGMRVFVDYYAFYALLLAILLTEIKTLWVKMVIWVPAILCLALSIVQTIQYNKFIFSYAQMNKVRYWHVFLKTGYPYGWMYEGPASKLSLFAQPKYYSGTTTTLITPADGNKLIYSAKVDTIKKYAGIWAYFSLWGNTHDLGNPAILITELKSPSGENHYSHSVNLKDDMAGTNELERVQGIFDLPLQISPDDSIKIYLSSPKDTLWIHDVVLQFGVRR